MLTFVYHHILTCYSTRTFSGILTCYLTAVKFEPQRYPVLPRLGSDSDEAGQDGLRDAVEDHLCCVCISMEDLCRQRKEQEGFNLPIFRAKRWNFCLPHGAETRMSAETDQNQHRVMTLPRYWFQRIFKKMHLHLVVLAAFAKLVSLSTSV